MKPVAWRSFDPKWKRWYLYQVKPADNAEPLYTAPRELSDEEILSLVPNQDVWKYEIADERIIEFARAVLKKVSEK